MRRVLRLPRGETMRILAAIEATETSPSYRFRVELRLVRLRATKLSHLEFDALCLDLDRLFERGDPDFLGPALRRFVRAWFLILHGDAALRRGDLTNARRWLEAAALEAGDLEAVARAALARLAES